MPLSSLPPNPLQPVRPPTLDLEGKRDCLEEMVVTLDGVIVGPIDGFRLLSWEGPKPPAPGNYGVVYVVEKKCDDTHGPWYHVVERKGIIRMYHPELASKGPQ